MTDPKSTQELQFELGDRERELHAAKLDYESRHDCVEAECTHAPDGKPIVDDQGRKPGQKDYDADRSNAQRRQKSNEMIDLERQVRQLRDQLRTDQ